MQEPGPTNGGDGSSQSAAGDNRAGRSILCDGSRPTETAIRSSLQIQPLSLGKMLKPIGTQAEILEEMLSQGDESDSIDAERAPG